MTSTPKKEKAWTGLKIGLVLAFLLVGMVGPAAAQNQNNQNNPCQGQTNSQSSAESCLEHRMNQVGNFLSIVIMAVAIPNGAFGVFQWMTAGTDTEQSDKGRKRIRNSFIGVAGAGAIMVAVRLLTAMVGGF